MLRKYKTKLIIISAGALLSVILFLARRSLGGLRGIFVPFLSRLFAGFPMGATVMIAGPLFILLSAVFLWLKDGADGLKSWFAGVIAAVFVLIPVLEINLLTNYTSPGISAYMGVVERNYSPDELCSLCVFLADECNRLAPQTPRSVDGEIIIADEAALRREVKNSYSRLAGVWSGYGADIGMPKTVRAVGRLMSVFGISGVYFPLTCEGMVSADTPASHIGFTIAHEAAHVYGIGPEGEANFSAFLCGTVSDDTYLRYSCMLNAYIYVFNALYEEMPEAAAIIASSLSFCVDKDLQILMGEVRKYEGPMQQAGDAINNGYLVITGQENGLKSYGEVVDLLLWWYSEKELTNT